MLGAEVEGVCGQNVCYHDDGFSDFLKFDMQHDIFLKKLDFALLISLG